MPGNAARASVVQTEADEQRYAKLVSNGWASPQRYEQAKAALDTAEAQLASAEADARVAENEATYLILVADADGTVRANGEVVARFERPHLWSHGDPFLYEVDIRDQDDVVHSYVGFRTIEKRGRELFLNGENLRLAGVLDQGFWPGTVYRASDEQLRADVAAAKELGFNLARKHVKVEDPRWYT